MLSNKSFFPTPVSLASRMICKIKGHPVKVLEPSAGKGDLIEALLSSHTRRFSADDIFAIESDPELQATLRGKSFKLIDSDFLAYSGPDKFDLIIANPPFENGEQHLLKALDIMYRGQIIFLLNAETLRNPHTSSRKLLVRRLDECGASIEYIANGFSLAERRTDVEVALVSIVIDRRVEDDLFAGAEDIAQESKAAFTEKHEVSNGRTISELVLEYNRAVQVGMETITGFYRNYRHIGKYLTLNDVGGRQQGGRSAEDLTGKLQHAVNLLLRSVRVDFWRRTLDLKDVKSRLTAKKQAEFEHALTDRCFMDFTESNIRQFVMNLIGGYEQTLTEAVLDVFDMFTVRHCWDDGLWQKNIHYFNGWKTNKAFKVGRRVIVPIRASYGNPFYGYSGLQLDYKAAEVLDDIDKVMNYFDGMAGYVSISDALRKSFAVGVSSGVESTYFKATAHKKGTIHLTFRNEDILRRFNVVACRGKGWLPQDYGTKPFRELTCEAQSVAQAFEGAVSYDKEAKKPLFAVLNGGSQIKIGLAA